MEISPDRVFFTSRAYRLKAHLYRPNVTTRDQKGAAIVIAHPWSSIKEQSPANYARLLCKAGFFCLTFDAAFQGESEGEPRSLEDPYQRVEDIKSAVTYLVGRRDVDSDRIGVLGICASGGYASFAAQTDLRIRACATTAAVCVGIMARRGFDRDSANLDTLKGQLELAAKDRNSDIGGEKVDLVKLIPSTLEEAVGLTESFQDLTQYFRKRQPHKRAPNTCLARSWDMMANFDAFAFNYLISPRPLLMITGSRAATRWFSGYGIVKAREPKELYSVEGLTHADLYDHVDEAGAKLVDFFEHSFQHVGS
ncbi:alpha/beta-hydrolase [Aaosphaeria arxii CBS 175.79]|uniref:Alpha/beta-hydrolase n=1 Tax=Aaosphaeria arxii CBS 175.79 TaxID=1450172 RepID=A0A6A5XCL8_9PLEO|nr:alpha/beta-hydrolase [Aaosphaeria arxii CBS 175.79]KAF2010718.1 alpha/beta-hydrolase [Aaosphaeria arxii CBS 175.79]